MGNHLKSLAAPKTWPIPRKRFVFVTKQHPGPHTLNSSMPLSVVLRDVLKALSVAREMKKALAAGKILVNGVVRKEMKFPVGIFDTVSVPDADELPSIIGLCTDVTTSNVPVLKRRIS